MNPEYRPIVMRANRLLGAALVEHNLVKIEDLEKANERLLQVISDGENRQISLLGILVNDMRVLREEDVHSHLVETEALGLVDLTVYEINEELRKAWDIGACWATWSIPFDKEEGFVSIATCYWLSPAVRTYWEKIHGDNILWYGTSMEGIAELLDKAQSA